MRTVVAVGVFVVAVLAWSAWRPLAAQPAAAPASHPGLPPGVGMPQPTRIEEFLARPDRLVIRDVTDVGAVEREVNDVTRMVRVQTVVVYDEAKPADRLQGLAVTVDNAVEPFTVLFDAEQIPKLQAVLSRLMATATNLRVPPRETRRHAVYGMNGLEIAIRAGGADGGYVGRAGL